MLLFLHRKVIRPHALGPVYTFGAPAVFCETDSGTVPVRPPACRAFTIRVKGLGFLQCTPHTKHILLYVLLQSFSQSAGPA